MGSLATFGSLYASGLSSIACMQTKLAEFGRYVPDFVEANPRYLERPHVDARIEKFSPEKRERIYKALTAKFGTWDLDGIPWDRCEAPSRFHKHWIQTVNVMTVTSYGENYHCACGASSDFVDRDWLTSLTPRVRRIW